MGYVIKHEEEDYRVTQIYQNGRMVEIQQPYSDDEEIVIEEWTPLTLVATAISDTAINLTWSGTGTAKVERSIDGVNYTQIGTGSLSYSDTGLSEYTLYYYRVKGSEYSNVSSDRTFVHEYTAGYTAMTNKPSKDFAQAYSTFIKTNVDSGFWATRDIFYLFNPFSVKGGEQLINLKNPGVNDATAGVAPLYTRLKGLKGDDSTMYIRTNYNPADDGVNYTLNSASIGAGSIVEKTAEAGNIISAFDGTTYSQIGNRWTGNLTYWIVNGVVANIDSVASATAIGNWMANRTAEAQCDLWRSKTKTPGTKVSTAVTDEELYILCRNNNGATNSFAPDTVDYAHAGGGVTDVQAEIFSDSIDTLRTFIAKTPTGTLEVQDRHIDYINGVYRFGWDDVNVFYSSDSGATWNIRAFTGADKIESSVIFANGNVWFSRLNKCYKSTDGLATAPSEVTPLDKAGNAWTAQNNLGETNAKFFKKSTSIDIVTIGGTEVAVWGNYANVTVAFDDCPINIYKMYSDCIPRITYTFGVNPSWPDAGDAGNAVICRHVHQIAYDPVNAVWYANTGDFPPDNPWLKSADQMDTWSVIANSPAVLKPTWNWAGLAIHDGEIYFSTDEGVDYIYKCLIADLETLAKWVELYKHDDYVYNFKIQDNGICIAVGKEDVLISQNFFLNLTKVNLAGYAGDFLKLDKISDNNYKVEKYTPTSGEYYHNDSYFIEIVKT